MSKVLKNHHLTISVAKDGSVNLKWDWDALIKEVQIATNYKMKTDIVDLMKEVSDGVNRMEDITKQNIATVTKTKSLVKETEKKVTKTRKKK